MEYANRHPNGEIRNLEGLVPTAREAMRQVGLDVGQHASADLLRLATTVYKSRRLRDEFFEADLLSEPGWDMLLAAYYIPSLARPLSVTGLCHVAACAPTTALRWIDHLIASGLLERQPSKTDKRVTFVSLTAKAKAQMEAYLTRISARDNSREGDSERRPVRGSLSQTGSPKGRDVG